MSSSAANASARRRRGAPQQNAVNTNEQNNNEDSNTPINPITFIKLLDYRLKIIEDNLPDTLQTFSDKIEKFEEMINGKLQNNNENNTNIENDNEIPSENDNQIPSIEELLDEVATLQQQIKNVQALSINTNNNLSTIIQKYDLLKPIEDNVLNTQDNNVNNDE